MIFTGSEFSLDSKSSKLQLSRLFVTGSVVFLLFDMASESTGSLSKEQKSPN